MGIYADKFGAVCDGRDCAKSIEPTYDSASALRADMQRDGWVLVIGIWLCPACAAKKAEAAR